MSTDMVPDSYWDWANNNPCEAKGCGKTDGDKPMCFRGERWCSDLHRKEVQGEGESHGAIGAA